jgi:hypothetical protein
MTVMHEHMHQRAGEQDQIRKKYQQMLTMLDQQEIARRSDQPECAQAFGAEPEVFGGLVHASPLAVLL